DVDTNQTLTFTATGLPGGATFTQTSATSAGFSWTPSETQTGNYTVNFTVRDNGVPALSDIKAMTISVLGQWSQTNGPYGGYIRTLLVNGGDLFAGTFGGGLFLSTNNGQSWTAINNGLPNTIVYALAVNGGNLFAGTERGVFLSTNNGQSWTAVNNGLANQPVYALAVNG